MKTFIRSLTHTALIINLLTAGSALAQTNGGSIVPPTVGTGSIGDPTGLSKPLDPSVLGTVLTVEIGYENGRWSQLGEADVIHCQAPKLGTKSDYASEIRAVDDSGRPVASRFIGNPLIVLPEDPRSDMGRLKSATVQLHIDLIGDPARIEFFENASRQDQPDLSIDLKTALAIFDVEGGTRIPNCEHSDPPMVRLGESQVYVLSYALDRASRVADIPADELLSMLSAYGSTIGKHVPMPKPALHLLVSSLREFGR